MHHIEITSGELVDRLTILDLKITNSNGIAVELLKERYLPLHDMYTLLVAEIPEIIENKQQLETVNTALWLLEDQIRSPDMADKESIAQKIIELNDRRSRIKNSIDELAGDASHEFKTYRAK